jgi:hypothetical protein
MPKDLLLLGANAPDMELLRTRLVRIGHRVVPAKTPEMAHTLMRVGGSRIGAVIVPADLPVVDIGAALGFLRKLAPPGSEQSFVGAGRDPGPEERDRLRRAGVHVACFDPIDLHTLRFQINRALAKGPIPTRARRGTQRAPADWKIVATANGRQKEGRLYSISPNGAFVVLPQPWMVKSQVEIRGAMPDGAELRASGRVVMTNVPGNLMRECLPIGMGVRFDQLSEFASIALMMYANQRSEALSL